MSFTGIEILTRNCTNCDNYKNGWCDYYDQDVTMDDEPCGRWENACIALLNESSDRNEWPISVTILDQKYDLTAEEAINLRDYLDRCIRRVAPADKSNRKICKDCPQRMMDCDAEQYEICRRNTYGKPSEPDYER